MSPLTDKPIDRRRNGVVVPALTVAFATLLVACSTETPTVGSPTRPTSWSRSLTDAGATAGAAGSGAEVRLAPGADVAAAVEQAPPSSTVRLSAGLYRIPRTIVPKDGQTVVGDRGAVVNGATALDSWQRSGATWSTTVPVPLAAEAGGKTESGWETSRLPYDLYVGDTLLRRVASVGEVSPTSWYLDPSSRQVVVGLDPTGRAVEISTLARAFGGEAQGVTLSGLVVEKFATPAQQGMINAPDGRGWTVTGSEIRYSHAAGVMVGSGSTVSDNSIHDNGQVGVKAWATEKLLIRGNRIRDNNTLHFDPFWEAGGVKVTNSRDVHIVDNEITGNGGFGAWADYSGVGISYERNKIQRNSLGGIQHEASFAALISGNTIVDNGAAAGTDSPFAGAAVYVYDSTDVEVRGNEIARNRCGIVGLVQDRGAATESLQPAGARLEVRNLWVHDNTIEMSTGYSGIIVDPRSDKFPYGTMDTGRARSSFTDANNRWDGNTYRGTGFAENSSPARTEPDRRFVWGDPLGGSDTTAWTTRRYVGRMAWQAYGQDRTSTFDVRP